MSTYAQTNPVAYAILCKVYDGLEAAGTPVTRIYFDGDWEGISSREEFLDAATSADWCQARTAAGSVFLQPYEGAYALSDYSTRLESALASAITYANRYN